MRVKAGFNVLLEDPKKHLGGLRVGLITNPTGVTADLATTLDALNEHGDIDLKAVFSPEHGARGDIQDGLPVESHVDKVMGLPARAPPGIDGLHHFDRLAGTDKIREALSCGTLVEDIVGGWSMGLDWFRERRREFLLYLEGER